MDSEKKQ